MNSRIPDAVNNVLTLPPQVIAEKIAPLLQLSSEQALAMMRHAVRFPLLQLYAYGEAPSRTTRTPDGGTMHNDTYAIMSPQGDYDASVVPQETENANGSDYTFVFSGNMTVNEKLDGGIRALVSDALDQSDGSVSDVLDRIVREVMHIERFHDRIMPAGLVSLAEDLEGSPMSGDADPAHEGRMGLDLFLRSHIREHLRVPASDTPDLRLLAPEQRDALISFVFNIRSDYVWRRSAAEMQLKEWRQGSDTGK